MDDLAATQAIHEVLYAYCRGLDRMDRKLADTVWHPDGTCNYLGMFEGSGHDFLDWVWTAHESLFGHSHQIANVLVRVDADAATSEAYVTATLRLPDGTDIVSRGRYLDRWSRRDGVWAIDHRVFVEDLPHDGSTTSAMRRDATDPSYDVLGWG